MRILLWHGYLLGGTGSNVYTRALAREWSHAGHEVVVFSQEAHPDQYDLGGAEVVRPDIGRLLPVFVLDRYEGFDARRLPELTKAERDAYVAANAAALREHLPADLVFANHVLLGGPVAAASGARYAVKAHGSELEYAMRGNEELSAWGRRRSPAPGPSSSAPSTSATCSRTSSATSTGSTLCRRASTSTNSSRFPATWRFAACSTRAAPTLPTRATRTSACRTRATPSFEAFFAADEPTVLYFGKLLHNKGVHVLFEALRELDARAVIVGFGDYRAELEALAPERTSSPARSSTATSPS